MESKWAGNFDWSGLAESASTPSINHKGLLRQSIVVQSDDAPSESTQAAKTPTEDILNRTRRQIRLEGKAVETERTYCSTIKAYIRMTLQRTGKTPEQVGPSAITHYLNYLALDKGVASGTQKLALNASVFLHRRVFDHGEFTINPPTPARDYRRPPTVLTRPEIDKLLECLAGTWKLVAELMYGAGLRVSEAVAIRIKDIDLGQGIIQIHDAKGGKHRVVPLPKALAPKLEHRLADLKKWHEECLAKDTARVHLPGSLARKYPKADMDFIWSFLFPAAKLCAHPRTGAYARYHLLEDSMGRQIKRAAKQAALTKRVTCHTLRHSFATHLLEANVDIRTVQQLLGHADVSTTMIYLHVAKNKGAGAPSPLDL